MAARWAWGLSSTTPRRSPSRSDTVTLANTISGNGSLTQSGMGELILTAANTYTGGTTVSSGTLAVLTAAALPYGTLTISAGGELLFGPGAAPFRAPDCRQPRNSRKLTGGLESGARTGYAAVTVCPAGGGGLLWHARRPRSPRRSLR